MKRVSPALSTKRAIIGRWGGYSTLFRYGREQMAVWGRLGGRPRLLTLAELETQRGMEKINTKGRQRHTANSFNKVNSRVQNMPTLKIRDKAGIAR